jgi:hypothetical protein
MRTKIKKFMNIYVVTGLIGGFSLLYILSFAFIGTNISNGSSAQMKRDYLKKEAIKKQKMEEKALKAKAKE